MLSRRSERFFNRVLSEFRSTKQELVKGTGPCIFSRRDPAKEQIQMLDYLLIFLKMILSDQRER